MSEIQWGLLPQQPNFAGNMANSFMLGREIAQVKQGDQALQKVRANPNDQGALTDLAVYNPQAANAFLTMQASQRQAQARGAAADVYRAYGNAMAPAAPTMQAPAQNAPASPAPAAPAAPQQPTQGAAPAPQQNAPQQAPKASPAALLQPDHPVTQQIGAAVASGQMNFNQALANFAQYADPQQTTQLINSVAQMDELRRTKLAESNGALGTVAQSLLQLPPAQRAAAVQQSAAYLQSHGVSADQIDQAIQAGLTDQQLHGYVGQAIGVASIIEQANKDRQFRQTDRQLGQADQRIALEGQQLAETRRHNIAEENMPVAVQYGSSLVNRTTGATVYDGMSMGGGGDTFSKMIGIESGGKQFDNNGKPLVSPKGAVGVAQVMPNTAPEAARLAGLPWDPQRYQNDPQYNMQLGRAYFQSLVQKYNGDEMKAAAAYNAGAGRVDAAIAKGGANWASQLPQETQNYVANLARNGGNSSAMDAQAKAIAEYRVPAPSGRAAMSPMNIALMQKVQALNPSFDETQYAMRGKVVKDFSTGKEGNTVRSLNVAVDHLDQLQLAAKALGNGNVQLFNSVSQGFANATGSPVPSNFNAIKNFVMDEVTKAIIGAGGGVGDRDKAAQVINQAQSPEQLAGSIYQVKKLMAGQLHGLQQQYEQGSGLKNFGDKLSPRTKQILGYNDQQGRQAPAGATATATGPNGAKIALVQGKWVQY